MHYHKGGRAATAPTVVSVIVGVGMIMCRERSFLLCAAVICHQVYSSDTVHRHPLS